MECGQGYVLQSRGESPSSRACWRSVHGEAGHLHTGMALECGEQGGAGRVRAAGLQQPQHQASEPAHADIVRGEVGVAEQRPDPPVLAEGGGEDLPASRPPIKVDGFMPANTLPLVQAWAGGRAFTRQP